VGANVRKGERKELSLQVKDPSWLCGFFWRHMHSSVHAFGEYSTDHWSATNKKHAQTGILYIETFFAAEAEIRHG
jgi:hypothetical protein